jgi:hypothetical protein
MRALYCISDFDTVRIIDSTLFLPHLKGMHELNPVPLAGWCFASSESIPCRGLSLMKWLVADRMPIRV